MDFLLGWFLVLLAGLALALGTLLDVVLHPVPVRRRRFDSPSQLPTAPTRDTHRLRGPPAF